MTFRARVVHTAARHRDCRDCVFKDQLFETPRLQNNREFVKASDPAGEFDSADQIDRDICPIPAEIVQESVLYVLCRLCLILHSRNASLSLFFW